MSQSTMTIGQIAAEAQMSKETIRFYERKGLLQEPRRSHTGYRLYDPAVLGRLRFIKKASHLGLSLNEIKEIFGMAAVGRAPCCRVRELLADRLEALDRKIQELECLRDEVHDFLGSIAGLPDQADTSRSVCNLIETMPPNLDTTMRTRKPSTRPGHRA